MIVCKSRFDEKKYSDRITGTESATREIDTGLGEIANIPTTTAAEEAEGKIGRKKHKFDTAAGEQEQGQGREWKKDGQKSGKK